MARADNPFEPYLIPNLNGGLNTRADKTLIEDNQVADCLNIAFDQPGVVGTRAGTEKVGNQVHASQTGKGIKGYTKNSGSTFLVWKCNATLYYITPISSTNTSIVGGLSSTSVMMDVYNDKLYVANDIDDFRDWDGSTTNTFVSVPKGNIFKIFENRAYISGQSANPSRLFFSDIAAPTTFGGGSYIDINPGDGYKITGLGIAEGVLMVSKGDNVNKRAGGVWQVTFSSASPPVPNGAQRTPAYKGWLNPKVYSQYESSGIYLSDDAVRSVGQQAYYPAGYRDSELSINIRPTIAALQSTWNTLSTGLYLNNTFYLSVPYAQGVYNDTVLVYAYGAWSFWNNIFAGEFEFWNNYLYYYDSRKGQLWRINPSLKNDDGVAIHSYLITKYYALGSSSVRKQISGIQARLLADANSTIRVSYSTDFNNYIANTTWTVSGGEAAGAPSTTPGLLDSFWGSMSAAFGGTSLPSESQIFATRRWSFNKKCFLISLKLEQEQLNKGFKLINFDFVARQLPYNDYYNVN